MPRRTSSTTTPPAAFNGAKGNRAPRASESWISILNPLSSRTLIAMKPAEGEFKACASPRGPQTERKPPNISGLPSSSG